MTDFKNSVKGNKFKALLLKYWNIIVSEFRAESPKLMIKNIGMILFGSALVAFASVIFYEPLHVVAGGTSGISIILANTLFIGDKPLLPYETWYLIISWSLFFIGILLLGFRFGVKTLISTLSSPLFVIIFQQLLKIDLLNLASSMYANINHDLMRVLSAIFGGAITGTGVAITFLGGGSTGGIDCITLSGQKYLHIKAAVMNFVCDCTIILSSLALDGSNLITVLTCFLATFVCSILIDKFLMGFEKKYCALIVSSKWQEINHEINYTLNRGTTILDSMGGYTLKKNKTIKVCFDRKQYKELINIVHKIDDKAFITLLHADEITGSGFKKMQVKKKYVRIKHHSSETITNVVPLEEITPLSSEELILQEIEYKDKKFY